MQTLAEFSLHTQQAWHRTSKVSRGSKYAGFALRGSRGADRQEHGKVSRDPRF